MTKQRKPQDLKEQLSTLNAKFNQAKIWLEKMVDAHGMNSPEAIKASQLCTHWCTQISKVKETLLFSANQHMEDVGSDNHENNMVLLTKKTSYYFTDYPTSDEGSYFELVDGEPMIMAPPSRTHQAISIGIASQLHSYLEGKSCEVYTAPFIVRLFEDVGNMPTNTVVEPDISVICDLGKLDDRGCKGAPDLVVEILSPSTQRRDRVVKYGLYQRAGVREYWIVNPEDRTVQVHVRKDGFFQPQEFYTREDTAVVNILEDCTIELNRVFPV